jgi:hypothetical protein
MTDLASFDSGPACAALRHTTPESGGKYKQWQVRVNGIADEQ